MSITKEQLRAVLTGPLTLAESIASVTPTKTDDAIVLTVEKVVNNDTAMNLVTSLINRLAGTLKLGGTAGSLPPEHVAALQAAIDALPC